jgi:hypothetical protein
MCLKLQTDTTSHSHNTLTSGGQSEKYNHALGPICTHVFAKSNLFQYIVYEAALFLTRSPNHGCFLLDVQRRLSEIRAPTVCVRLTFAQRLSYIDISSVDQVGIGTTSLIHYRHGVLLSQGDSIKIVMMANRRPPSD